MPENLKNKPKTLEQVIQFNKKNVINRLLKLGASQAVIEYEGSGDSGQVESIFVTDKDGKEMKLNDLKTPYYSHSTVWSGGKFETTIRKSQMPLDQALDNIACDLLDYNSINWFDNDGGFGSVVIDIAANSLTLKHNQRISTYEEFQWRAL